MLFVALTAVSFAQTIISEGNIGEDGDIVANVEYSFTATKKYYSVDITYTATDGQIKDGKFYYLTSDGLYNNRLQLEGVYVPKDFDLSQTVYIFDKADLNGDGEFSEDEKIKGSNGGGNSQSPTMHWRSYQAFDNEAGAFIGEQTDVRALVQSLSYPKYMQYFGHWFLCRGGSLKTVTYNGKKAVEGTIIISSRINEIMSNGFGGDGGNTNNSNLTPDYTRIVFEAREGSVSMGQYAFCRGVVEEVVFLSGRYSFHGQESIAYQLLEGTSTPSLKRIVLDEGTTFGSGTIKWNVGSYDIVYLGSEDGYSYDNYSSCLTNATGSVIYEELCYVWGHTAGENDYDCTTALGCIYAGDGCGYLFEEARQHVMAEEYTYENGYLKSGTYKNACANEGCGHGEESEISPLATSKGYSLEEGTNSGAIVFGITFNREAILAYESYLGTKIEFGLLASNEHESPLNDDASAKTGTVKTSFEDTKYSIFHLKLTNIAKDKWDSQLHLGAYLVIGNEISYVNNKEISQNSALVSYNIVATLVGDEEK